MASFSYFCGKLFYWSISGIIIASYYQRKMRTILLILIPLTGLAQKRLIPNEFNLSNHAETVSIIEGEGITVFVECLEVNRDLLVFDIEFKNESGYDLRVDPQSIYYYGAISPFPDLEDYFWELSNKGEFAFDHLGYSLSQRTVAHYYERKVDSKQRTKTLLAVLGATLIVFDAVIDGQDYRGEPSRQRANKSLARDVVVNISLSAIDIAGTAITNDQIKSDEDLYYLPDEFLPPDFIKPNEFIRGKVYFSQIHKHNYYRLMVPVNDLFFVFDFRWPDGLRNNH